MTGELRESLEAAGAESGRSVSEEVEHRLDQALAQERLLGDPDTLKLVRHVLTSADLIQSLTGADWKTNVTAGRALGVSFVKYIEQRFATMGAKGEAQKQALTGAERYQELKLIQATLMAQKELMRRGRVGDAFANGGGLFRETLRKLRDPDELGALVAALSSAPFPAASILAQRRAGDEDKEQ